MASETRPRREQILDVALGLFAAHGLSNVTTRQIAAAVGISQPSLYAHFPNRDAIAAELCCRAFDDLHQRVLAAIKTPGTPQQRLRRLGAEYVRFGLQNEAAYRVAFMRDLPEAHDSKRRDVLMAGVNSFGVLHGLIEEVHGPGTAMSDAIARSAWASLHGLVALLLDRPEFPWGDLEQVIAVHLDRFAQAALLPAPEQP